MVTEEFPPDLDETPEIDDEPILFDNEDERAALRPDPALSPQEYGVGIPGSGYTDEWSDPYRELGGLTRPDAYFGAKEFDCLLPELGGCGQPKGQKCVVWVERLGRYVPRKMPCISRIRRAKEAGLI